MLILVKLVQLMKTEKPILVTLSGSVMEVKLVQFPNINPGRGNVGKCCLEFMPGNAFKGDIADGEDHKDCGYAQQNAFEVFVFSFHPGGCCLIADLTKSHQSGVEPDMLLVGSFRQRTDTVYLFSFQ